MILREEELQVDFEIRKRGDGGGGIYVIVATIRGGNKRYCCIFRGGGD